MGNNQCFPVDGMSQAQCTHLAGYWAQQFALARPCVTAGQTLTKQNVNVWTPTAGFSPTVWVGPGCPSSCAERAAKLHMNPRRFCARLGQSTTYPDGGCKLYYDCNISCESVCKKQPHCMWEGTCKPNPNDPVFKPSRTCGVLRC